jgi:hypothetical protein
MVADPYEDIANGLARSTSDDRAWWRHDDRYGPDQPVRGRGRWVETGGAGAPARAG